MKIYKLINQLRDLADICEFHKFVLKRHYSHIYHAMIELKEFQRSKTDDNIIIIVMLSIINYFLDLSFKELRALNFKMPSNKESRWIVLSSLFSDLKMSTRLAELHKHVIRKNYPHIYYNMDALVTLSEWFNSGYGSELIVAFLLSFAYYLVNLSFAEMAILNDKFKLVEDTNTSYEDGKLYFFDL